MPNEFIARNGVIAQNNSVISGSLVITGGITGSLSGTSAQSLTSSFVNSLSQSLSITGNLSVTGSAGTVLSSNADTLLITGSLIVTGSSTIIGNQAITGSITQAGTNVTASFSGLVGIGVTSPASILDARAGAGTSGNILNLSNTTGAAAGNIVPIRFYSGNTFGGLEQTAAIWGINPNAGTNNGGALVFATSTNGTSTTPTEKVRISNNGQTTFNSPSSIIANNQGIRVYSTDSQAADLGGGISFGGNYVGTSTTADFANIKSGKDNSTSGNYAGYLAFSTNAQATGNVERLRINSIGQTLIGGTSSLYTNTKLSVKQTDAYLTAEIWSNYGSDFGSPALTIIKNDNNTSQVFQRFAIDNGNAANGQINGNGASQVAFGSWSDRRLKENIVDLPSQLNNILALKPSEFDYKNGSGHQIGFIAQEMQEVYPDTVGEDSDGFLTVTGWSKTEARLVKAIQEQQVLIQELTTRITALENK